MKRIISVMAEPCCRMPGPLVAYPDRATVRACRSVGTRPAPSSPQVRGAPAKPYDGGPTTDEGCPSGVARSCGWLRSPCDPVLA
jgi:hypothetical protein